MLADIESVMLVPPYTGLCPWRLSAWTTQMAAFIGADEAVGSIFEQWDGKGMPIGLKGEAIPLVRRIVILASYLEVAHRSGGRPAALRLGREHRGKHFDPTVVVAFEKASARDSFWSPLEQESISPNFVELVERTPAEPPSLDDFAACCADFVDMKSFWLAGHSRRVAAQVERLAGRLRLGNARTDDLKVAALVHDLGLVAVPSFVINKAGNALSDRERQAFESHAHHVSALLARFDALAEIGESVAAHHERLDDSGYTRGLRDHEISLGAGLIAAASRFDELTRNRPGSAALDPEQALSQMTTVENGAYRPDVLAALRDDVPRRSQPGPAPAKWPAGLTDREVQILRLAARGLTRRQIAGHAVVSDSTVRSHLEHIYDKTGSTTRVGAVLFAIERGLIS